jgi:hypothetical protein
LSIAGSGTSPTAGTTMPEKNHKRMRPAMTQLSPMKTIATKNVEKTAKFRLSDLYPLAGIVSIATYIVVELLLE